MQLLASGQRTSSNSGYAPETTSTSSHPLYGQGYQNYGTSGQSGQSFSQYQPSPHQQAYQNYNAYQVLPLLKSLAPSCGCLIIQTHALLNTQAYCKLARGLWQELVDSSFDYEQQGGHPDQSGCLSFL